MLSVPAPFPNPGAMALLIEAHQAHPVRIMSNGEGRGRNRTVLVSLLDRIGSSGNRRVKLAALEDPTPLSEAEQAEYQRLERELAGQSRPLKAKADRLERLRLRAVHAERLEAEERRAHRMAAAVKPMFGRRRA